MIEDLKECLSVMIMVIGTGLALAISITLVIAAIFAVPTLLVWLIFF